MLKSLHAVVGSKTPVSILVRPRTEGRLDGLEHSGLEGALRLSGLVLCLSLLRGGLGLQEFWRGPPPVRTQLIQQFFAEEVQVQILEELAPVASAVNGSSLEFVEDRSRSFHRCHLVCLLGLLLGNSGGVEPGLDFESLHRRRVEGPAFLALFLVPPAMGASPPLGPSGNPRPTPWGSS